MKHKKTSESQKQVDWKLTNKPVSPLWDCRDLPNVKAALYQKV